MDMNKVRYFCTIADCGSLAKAAIELGISPAALSKAMNILFEEVGTPLFVHQGRGIMITDEGRRFAEKGKEVLIQMEILVQYARGPEQDQGIIRIGSFEVFTTYLIGHLIKSLGDEYKFRVRELLPGQIENALTDGSIDFGLTYMPIATNDIEHLQVGKTRSGVYGLKKQFVGKQLEELPFVVPLDPLSGTPSRAHGLDGWKASFGNRKIIHKVSLMETALEILRQGMGVAYLPSFIVELHNKYVTKDFKLEEVFTLDKAASVQPLYLVKHVGKTENIAMKKIAKIIRNNIL